MEEMDLGESTEVKSDENEAPPESEIPSKPTDVSDSDDSDDDSDSSSNAEIPENEEEIDSIPAPFDYNGHIERIKRLRKRGDFARLREARETMNITFPLSPELWLSWLEDERLTDKSSNPEGRALLVQLFDRAVADYLSVDIWVEYVYFSIGYMDEPDGSIDKVRSVFERGLIAAGLHVAKGALLWEAFREFEGIILSSVMQNCDGENSVVAEQLKRVANLFKRQLSVPLLNMEKTYSAFEEWLENHKAIWTTASGKPESALLEKSNVDLAYKKALDRLHQIQPYEDVLNTCEESMKVSHYKEYLKFEQSLGEPVRLLCLFERALSDCPLDAPLWLGYLEFSDGLGDYSQTLLLCKRAVRNCPWYALLWQQYLRCMEKTSESPQAVKGVFEEALKSGLQTAEDFRNIWLEYCCYLRRRIDWGSNEEAPLLTELRETIRAATEYLSQAYGDQGDPSCQLLRFMATVEAVQSRKMEMARKIWNDILYSGHKTSAASWLQYIHLEMAYGDSKHLRKLFPRALQAARDWPESIVEEWLQFERVEGTLDSYEEALYKCRTRIKQVTAEREKAAAEEAESQQAANIKKGEKKKERNRSVKGDDKSDEKRPQSLKRAAPVEHDTKSREQSNDQEKSSFKKPKIESIEDLGVVTEHDPSKDNRTVFVSNLDYSTTNEQIREVFSSVGTITELRLVRDFKGRSKGFCYIVFSSFNEMNEALKKDRVPIDGRPIFVSKCDPDKHTRQHSFKYSTALEKNKLFVKGLPLSSTKEELEELFGKYGKVKDIRLVTYRNGHFKGLAYVDFVDEVSAAQALIKVDGTTMGGRTVSVALSNPPDRRTSLLAEQNEPSTSSVQSLGGGLKDVGPRGRGRTQVAFLPRALQVKPEDSKSDERSAAPSNGAPKPRSNADFRKLLLEKK
ncbi:Squamous cell carcinoma antigen recognized by T-cells 3 [Frankliniella fusca]|uniref:Squamous cell carcinoma antigen recognized by T-cells 3 n=1 Tax=Frankliniella fusca TaxID=407009 RepID=A0AAE1LQK8_9NEOP|nr:Squamous cell carcinoma antigen recognized by T-cells 3 [Frankliniella fusca]